MPPRQKGTLLLPPQSSRRPGSVSRSSLRSSRTSSEPLKRSSIANGKSGYVFALLVQNQLHPLMEVSAICTYRVNQHAYCINIIIMLKDCAAVTEYAAAWSVGQQLLPAYGNDHILHLHVAKRDDFEPGHTILLQHVTVSWSPFYACLLALSSKANKLLSKWLMHDSKCSSSRRLQI